MVKKITYINSDSTNTNNYNKPWLNTAEFDNFLAKEIKKLESTAALNDKKFKMDIKQSVFILLNNANLRYEYIKVDKDYISVFYHQELEFGIPIWREVDYKTLAMSLIRITDMSPDVKKIAQQLNDFMSQLKPSVIEAIINKDGKYPVKKMNFPPNEYVLFKNGVLNVKTKTFDCNIDNYQDYNFTHVFSFKIPKDDEIDFALLEVIKRIYNDWADNNEENLVYLQQLSFAAIDGYGREKLHFLLGNGGNGKSTFISMLRHLSHSSQSLNMELNRIGDDDLYGNITPSVKLVYGEDLSTNTVISGASISRLKKYVSSEPDTVIMKYKPASTAYSFGLKIQATNSKPTIHENSAALRRRICLFNWTNRNFTELTNEDSFDLNSLVGKNIKNTDDLTKQSIKFYETLVYYILNNVDYFDEFVKLTSVVEATDELINSADSIYNFLQDGSESGMFDFNIIPTNLLYAAYIDWLKVNNSSAKPAGRRNFSNRITELSEQFGYKLQNQSLSIKSHKSLDFNLDLFKNQFLSKNQIDSLGLDRDNKIIKSNYLKSITNKISDDSIIEIKDKLANNEFDLIDISMKNILILLHLVTDNNNKFGPISEKAIELLITNNIDIKF